MSSSRRPGATLSRYVPVGYLMMTLVLIVTLLPTALRPPQQPPNTSAELSPDAPPEPEQEAIVSVLNRGTSGTAGAGPGEGDGNEQAGDGGPTPTTAPPEVPAPRGCPRGFGDPPRQTFSLYSAPCALAWQGDNGGATSNGVTATEVRVAVGHPGADLGTEGPVAASRSPDQSDEDRTWTVLQAWFNASYQFYGRRLQLYLLNLGFESDSQGETAEDQRAAATKAAEFDVFAADMGRDHAVSELARRGIIGFGEKADQWSDSFLDPLAPYAWQWRSSTTHVARTSAEYICKRLVGKRAEFAGDPMIAARDRVFGLVYNESASVGPIESEMRRFLAEECDLSLAVAIGWSCPHSRNCGSDDPESTSTAVTRLRERGVTTVVHALDAPTMWSLANSASAQGYYPEWFITGRERHNDNVNGQLTDQTQWAHAFGLNSNEIEDLPEDDANVGYADFYRAYKEMDPGGEPCCRSTIDDIFPQLLQIANGIQMAGPHLTPHTFEQGLFAMDYRPPVPRWSIGGGWGPGHYYAQDVGEIWWDTRVQKYRWTNQGQKWRPGELVGDTSQLFNEGVTTRAEAASAGS